MRGYNIAAPGSVGYVDWVVNDVPDGNATYVPSPYISANITNITVNKTVTSKVDNFLKPFESLTAIGGTGYDGYFFHLNSYDWLHATPPGPPIPVPSYKTGLSVVRGTADGIIPRDYATLFWAEDALKWLFAYNTNGDGYTVGAALPVGMGSLSVDGYIEVGTNPAESGIIRIPNNQFIVSRNATDTADGYLIGQDTVNRVRLGSAPGNQIYIPANLRVDGYVRDGGTSPALSGFIRNSNNTSIVAFRNAANSNDITALSSTSGNLVVLGDAVNSGVRFNSATGFEHIFQINSINLLRIGNIGTTTYINFENTAPNPIVSQFDATIGNGQNLTLRSQNTTSVAGIGGSTIIASGHGLSRDGYVELRTHNTPKVRVFGSTVPSTPDFDHNDGYNPNSFQLFNPKFRFYDDVRNNPSPDGYYSGGSSDGYFVSITQDPINGTDGYGMLVLAQATVSSVLKGGDLKLSSGSNTNHTRDGYVRLQTGQVDRLFINARDGYVTQTLRTFAFNGPDGAFDAAVVANPIIKQRDNSGVAVTGQLMTIQAQDTPTPGGLGTIGGSLNITSGHGTRSAFEGDGYVRLQTGGTTRVLLDGYNNQASLTLNKFSFNGVDGYPDAVNVVNPIIRQRDYITNSITANSLTVQAQNAPGTSTIGGNLILKSGIGTAIVPSGGSVDTPYFRNGRIFFEVGSVTNNVGEFGVDGYGSYFSSGSTLASPAAVDGYFRVPNNTVALSAARFSPAPPNASIHLIRTDVNDHIFIGDVQDHVRIPGTLHIGTYSTETELLIEDRLIHANFSEIASVPPPSLIAGFTVHRGDNGAVSNNEAGLIWVEGINLDASDGYWKAASVVHIDGYGEDTSLSTSLNIMGRSLSITNDPNISLNLLPGSGGLRTLNNTTAVSSRNATGTQDLLLLGTDGYNHIVLGAESPPVNTGFIFNTTAGSVYDFRVESTSNKIQIGDGYIRSGANPATDGYIRISQDPTVVTEIINVRNSANNNNLKVLGVDGYDHITMGASSLNTGFIFSTSLGSVYDFRVNGLSNKVMIGDGYVRFGATPALDGYIRSSQDGYDINIITARKVDNSADLKLLGVDGYDRITHGVSALNKGHIFDTAVDGYYDFRVNSVPTASIINNKFVFNKGRRRNVNIVTTDITISDGYDYIAVDTSLPLPAYTITLPVSPTLGDSYEFKDINGNAATTNVTVDGNGQNIDGISTLVINTNFASFVVTYTGAQWSVS
jgi:hypothetical protein